MSELVVLGFPDAAAARIAYDEVLNLADSDDLALEALALRTSGPAGRIFIEVPNQLVVGSNSSGPLLADFLTTVLEGQAGAIARGRRSDMNPGPATSPAVLVMMAARIGWQRFRETMSIFDCVTVEIPADTSNTSG